MEDTEAVGYCERCGTKLMLEREYTGWFNRDTGEPEFVRYMTCPKRRVEIRLYNHSFSIPRFGHTKRRLILWYEKWIMM